MTSEFELPAELLAADAFVLDVGGEGRHLLAWNLNHRQRRSGASHTGRIPRLILARADAMPLSDASVDLVIVERTPLRPAALQELVRVIKPNGRILLRHAITPVGDPHRVALRWLPGTAERRQFTHRGYQVQETLIQRGRHG